MINTNKKKIKLKKNNTVTNKFITYWIIHKIPAGQYRMTCRIKMLLRNTYLFRDLFFIRCPIISDPRININSWTIQVYVFSIVMAISISIESKKSERESFQLLEKLKLISRYFLIINLLITKCLEFRVSNESISRNLCSFHTLCLQKTI